MYIATDLELYISFVGLCGNYDNKPENDAELDVTGAIEEVPGEFKPKKGTNSETLKERWQPNNFSITWR